jgi:histidinol-phosphate/aromatic aminotransferase/cobyric acid decarboxylase-like protein
MAGYAAHGADGAIAPHGGNRIAIARRLGCRPDQLLEASASLVPFPAPASLRRRLGRALAGGEAVSALRDYPDRDYTALRGAIAAHHGLDPAAVLPGNGAAELFTWIGRDAAAAGVSLLPSPGFADYRRALACWDAPWRPLPLPLDWPETFPQAFPFPQPSASPSAATGADPAGAEPAGALWITNPHNPTGQLWSRASLEPLLARFVLVVVDEAFLPLLPGGEAQSLVPLLRHHPNLVVVRSLTKLFAIAGLRLGYALAAPERLARWAAWRDPWPVNGLAALAGQTLLGDRRALEGWLARVQGWVADEGPWLAAGLRQLQGIEPLPSAANFLLVRGVASGQPCSLEPLRQALESRHRILVRDCRSFDGLGESWLRIALLDRAGNRRLLRALGREAAAGIAPGS